MNFILKLFKWELQMNGWTPGLWIPRKFFRFLSPPSYVKIWFISPPPPPTPTVWNDVMKQYNLLVIDDFLSGIQYAHYKHVVVDCIPPDVYFAPSNIWLCATTTSQTTTTSCNTFVVPLFHWTKQRSDIHSHYIKWQQGKCR